MNIKELCPTASSAIRAMVSGLRQAETRGLRLNMDTFGKVLPDACYGCAATATVMQACGVSPREAIALYTGDMDVQAFELTIDSFRRGSISYLLKFYDVDADKWSEHEDQWYLTIGNALEQLPRIEAFAQLLEGRGL